MQETQEMWVWSLGGEDPLEEGYSCLGNPVDRGAWWAIVHGVANSGTQLKWLNMPAYIYIFHLACWRQGILNMTFCKFRFLLVEKPIEHYNLSAIRRGVSANPPLRRISNRALFSPLVWKPLQPGGEHVLACKLTTETERAIGWSEIFRSIKMSLRRIKWRDWVHFMFISLENICSFCLPSLLNYCLPGCLLALPTPSLTIVEWFWERPMLAVGAFGHLDWLKNRGRNRANEVGDP